MRRYKGKVITVALALAVCLAGCGSVYSETSSKDAMANGGAAMAPEGAYEENWEMSDAIMGSTADGSTTGGSTTGDVRAGRKLIRTVSLEVETLDYDGLLLYVQNKTAELGGYVENMNAHNGSDYYRSSYNGTGYRNNRYANLTLRIPKDKLDGFVAQVEDNSNITDRSEQEWDVTLDYVDLDSHKKVLLAEQERLLTFLEQAETVEDMITLEKRLSDIRYQIESMESRLRTYDNQIDYSTVSLSITEVVELTPVEKKEQTVLERMGEGFMHSMRNIGHLFKEIAVRFVIMLPYILLLAVSVLITWGIIMLCIKVSNRRKLKKQRNQIHE